MKSPVVWVAAAHRLCTCLSLLMLLLPLLYTCPAGDKYFMPIHSIHSIHSISF